MRIKIGSGSNTGAPDSTLGSGCLLLFALPFALVGTMVMFFGVLPIVRSLIAQGWEEVPGTIVRAEVVSSGDTKHLESEYRYTLDGIEFSGDRVTFYSGSDSISSFHDDKLALLQPHLGTGVPFPIHVNRSNPSESVLFPEVRWGASMFLLMFGGMFASVGYGMLAAGFFGIRSARASSRLRKAHPNEPWMHRDDWAKRTVTSSALTPVIAMGVVAFIWNGISSMLPMVIISELSKPSPQYAVLFLLLFNVVGAGLIWYFCLLFLRWRRFGSSTLKFDALPLVLGGEFRGTLLVHPALREVTKSIDLGIRCLELETRGHGKNRTTYTNVLAEAHETVAIPGGSGRNAEQLKIPVSIKIPRGAPETIVNGNPRVQWKITVDAEIKGPNFHAEFEIPVFEAPHAMR